MSERLAEAALDGNFQKVKQYLDEEDDIHYHNDYILRCAAYYGYIEIIKLSLDRGADKSANNYQALKWAKENNNKEVIDLLENESKIQIEDSIIQEFKLPVKFKLLGGPLFLMKNSWDGATYEFNKDILNVYVEKEREVCIIFDGKLLLYFDEEKLIDIIGKMPSNILHLKSDK